MNLDSLLAARKIELAAARKTEFYRQFLALGEEQTRRYLQQYTGVKKLLAGCGRSRLSDEYWGAKTALETLIAKRD